MTSIFVIKKIHNIYGCYDNLDLAKDFIKSCINCKLINDSSLIKIYEYKINTNIVISEHTVDSDINEDIPEVISEEYETDSVSSESTSYSVRARRIKEKKQILEEHNNIGNEKNFFNYQINLLKLEKKKIEEKENVYNYDLNLFNKFKEIKNKNTKFTIPELFVEKYNVFEKLEDENNLSFENFDNLFVKKQLVTKYDSMFDTCTFNKETIDELDEKYELDTELKNDTYDDLYNIAHQ